MKLFLSRLLLDPRSGQVQRELARPYELHRTILRAFPAAGEGGPGRVLFRVETPRGAGPIPVLVQSDRPPDWAQLRVSGSYLWRSAEPRGSCVESKEVRLEVRAGQALRFRLRANPTKKLVQGPRLGLLHEAEQLAWLARKGEAGGFRPLAVTLRTEGMGEIRGPTESNASPIRMLSVRFEGRLAVTEPSAFLRTVASGVGSGKGFGFGLLSLAPDGGGGGASESPPGPSV